MLGSQHVGSIIDPDSERGRPFQAGIPEEPQQLELQVRAGSPRLAATCPSAALPACASMGSSLATVT